MCLYYRGVHLNLHPHELLPLSLPPSSLGARTTTSSILLHLDQLCGYEQQLREKEGELREVCAQLGTVEKVATRLAVLYTWNPSNEDPLK